MSALAGAVLARELAVLARELAVLARELAVLARELARERIFSLYRIDRAGK